MKIEHIALKEKFLNEIGQYCTGIASIESKKALDSINRLGSMDERVTKFNLAYKPMFYGFEVEKHIEKRSLIINLSDMSYALYDFLSENLSKIKGGGIGYFLTDFYGNKDSNIFSFDGMIYTIPNEKIVEICKCILSIVEANECFDPRYDMYPENDAEYIFMYPDVMSMKHVRLAPLNGDSVSFGCFVINFFMEYINGNIE